MKRQDEEKLIQIAFGEGTQGLEAALSELKGDKESAEFLANYHSLSTDLKLLRDVPECQLSKERLRDAILASGLEKKTQSPAWLQWTWMPAVAAAIICVGFFLKQGGKSEPRIQFPSEIQASTIKKFPEIKTTPFVKEVDHGSLATNSDGPNILDSMNSLLEEARSQVRIKPERVSRATKVVHTPSFVSKSLHRADHSKIDPEIAQSSAKSLPVAAMNAPASETASAVSMDTTALEARALNTSVTPQPVPVVLISSSSDLESGASQAKEISNPENVLVGG